MNLPRSRRELILQTLLPALLLLAAAIVYLTGLPGLPLVAARTLCTLLALLAASFWAVCLTMRPADEADRRRFARFGGIAILVTLACAVGNLLPLACAAVLAAFLTLDLRAMRGDPPDGRNWPDLLARCALPIQILDRMGETVYQSACAKPLDSHHRDLLLFGGGGNNTIPYDEDTMLCSRVIFPGVVVQQIDQRRFHQLTREEAQLQMELQTMQRLLDQKETIAERLRILQARSAFLATQESLVREKAPTIGVLLHCAAAPNPEPGFRRMAVTRANLLICELYQQGLLLHACDEAGNLTAADLTAALEGLTQAAADADVRCRIYQVAQGVYPADKLLESFRLLCRFLEQLIMEDLVSMDIRLRNEQDTLRMLLTAPGADAALAERALQTDTTLRTAIRETVDGVTLTVEFSYGGGASHA